MSSHLLLVTSPVEHPNHSKAIKLAHELSESEDVTVFFYEDAVYAGNILRQPPQGQQHPAEEWTVNSNESVKLVLCIAAAVRRGIFDTAEASRYQRPTTMAAGFELGGLGIVAEALADGYQVQQF